MKHLSQTSVLIVLCTLCTSALRASAPTPATYADQINRAMQKLYLGTAGVQAPPSAAEIAALRGVPSTASTDPSGLVGLIELEGAIQQLGAGTADRRLKEEASRATAAALLHGWLTLSQLLLRLPLGESDVRSACVSGPTSPLALFIQGYAKLRVVSTSQNPFLDLLGSAGYGSQLVVYRQPWDGPPPSGVTFDGYLPSTTDLVGAPSDAPVSRKQMLTLWAILNQQLDTWRPFNVGGTAANPLILADRLDTDLLANWFRDLSENTDITPAFDLNEAGKALGSLLRARANRFEHFLRFRRRIAEDGTLDSVAHDLAVARAQQTDPASVSELRIAGAPLLVDGQPEYLYDALIWLKYLLLLSYNGGSELIPSPDAGFDAQWGKFQFPNTARFTLPNSVAPGSSAVLRWNAQPLPGSVAAVLNALTDGGVSLMMFRAGIRKDAPLHFSAAQVITFSSAAGNVANPPVDDHSRQSVATRISQLLPDLESAISRLAMFSADPVWSATPHIAATAATVNLAPLRNPSRLLDNRDVLGRAFHRTATESEQTRLSRDVAMIATELAGQTFTFAHVVVALNSSQPDKLAVALRSATLSPLDSSNVYSRPQRSFEQYSRAVGQAIKRLNDASAAAAIESSLRDNYEDRVRDLRRKQLLLAASRVGREIADRAVQVNQTFQQIAGLDAQIADLNVQISNFRKEAYSNSQEAAAARMALATRTRELANARVAGLSQAADQVKTLVDNATSRLNELADNIRVTAQHIEDEQARQKTLSIIHTVVSIVGAALAPFTGGASLGVASALNQAITIVDAATHADWTHLDSTLAIVGNIAQGVGGALNTATALGANAKQAISDCQQFLAKVDSAAQSLASLAGGARTVMNGLSQLSKPDLVTFAAGIANGVSITVNGPKLSLALGQSEMTLTDAAINSALSSILNAGGIVLTSGAVQAATGTDLIGLSEVELRNKLSQRISGAIQVLPDDVLAMMNVQRADAETHITAAKTALLQRVNEAPVEAVRLLAQAFSTRLLFRVDSAGIVHLSETPATSDLGDQVTRLNNFAKNVAEKQIRDAANKLAAAQHAIEDKASALAKAQDPLTMRQLADAMPEKIDDAKQVLTDLQVALSNAEDDLQDKKDLAKVAGYEASATALFAKAAALDASASLAAATKAALTGKYAEQLVTQSLSEVDRSDLLLQAAIADVSMAETAVERTFVACLAYGLNPLSPEGSGIASPNHVSIATLLSDYMTAQTAGNRVAVQQAASGLVGMIQWIAILNVPSNRTWRNLADADQSVPRTVSDWYGRVVQLTASVELVPNTLAAFLTKSSDELQQIFSSDANVNSTPRIAPKEIGFNDVTWLLSNAERSIALEPVPIALRGNVIGSFSFVFGPEGNDYSPVTVNPTAFYVDASRVQLSSKATNLNFVIVPPPTPKAFDGQVADSGTNLYPEATKPKQVLSPEDEVELKSFMSDLGLWKDFSLIGAKGTWQIFLLSGNATDDNSRRQRVNQLKAQQGADLRLKVPNLEVTLTTQ